MRAVLVVALLALAVPACAELGVVTDGSTISYGRPSQGRLIDGVRMPEKGDGFTTRAVWEQRGNRYGTDELVELVKGVAHRLRPQIKDVRLVVADLSAGKGGASHKFHRSHQNGRDVDLLYYMRGADGKPLEADAMHVFDRRAKATDGSGITIDIDRTWLLVRELLTADEAFVQYIFMYQPIAQKLIDHAVAIGEPELLVTRAQRALKQPGDSARHDDHLHVRIYCPATDRQFGCVDIGPLEMLAEREAEQAQKAVASVQGTPSDSGSFAAEVAESAPPAPVSASDVWARE